MPAVAGRPPANGVDVRSAAVKVPLTRAEVTRLDCCRGYWSRADALARVAGLRGDGPRGGRVPVGDTGLFVERVEGALLIFRGEDQIACLDVFTWMEAMLDASSGPRTRRTTEIE